MEPITLIKELRAAVDDLTPREKAILEMRFGIRFDVPKTLEEIGKEFNVTRERIRQIEAKALDRIRLKVAPSSGDKERVEN